MYSIKETNDYHALSKLFHDSGMEVEVEDVAPQETIKMWRCDNDETGELLAGAVLQFKSGCYVLEDLAVTERYRGKGLGKTMMDIALDEARRLGAEEIWGCAKVPDYYFQYNWQEIDRETSPEISHCQSCKQFGKSCFPCIIKKEL